MSALGLYTFEARELHVIQIDGEPWFVAGDVAALLGYSATAAMTRSMDAEDRGVHVLHTPGGEQTVTIISEPGLYDAIQRSRVAGAEKFKRWVRRDVLPQIRKSGSYNAPAGISFEEMTAQVIAGLQERIEEAQARAKELESPARAWDSLSKAEGDFTISDSAKTLARDGHRCPGPRQLHDWMQEKGWIFRRGGRWQAMQTAVNAGLLVERVTSGYHDQVTGERKQGTPQVRVTPKGLQRLRDLLASERELVLVGGGA